MLAHQAPQSEQGGGITGIYKAKLLIETKRVRIRDNRNCVEAQGAQEIFSRVQNLEKESDLAWIAA